MHSAKHGALATRSYNDLGNRTGVSFGNGVGQTYAYDPVSRLSQLTTNLTDANNLTATFSYDPANWITSTTRTGDMYASTGAVSGNTAYVANGLEQTSVGGISASNALPARQSSREMRSIRSWRSWASRVMVAIGRASRRPSEIGSPVTSQ